MEIRYEGGVAADMVEAASNSRRAGESRHYLGMSMIGDPCERRIWYSFRGYTPKEPDGRIQMIFSLGDRVEEEVVKWLELGGHKVEGRQDGFEALNGLFRGHCDGVVHGITQKPHILEVKSAKDARFKAFKVSGVGQVDPKYAAQIQCYMGYSGLDRGIWVVMNKNDCSILEERVHFDRQEFERIERKARRIIASNIEPARAFVEGSRECQWCDYEFHCWRSPYLQSERTCGTCAGCVFDGIEPRCSVHMRKINHWGRSCDQWVFRDELDKVPF